MSMPTPHKALTSATYNNEEDDNDHESQEPDQQ
jgi:hypothetical protein